MLLLYMRLFPSRILRIICQLTIVFFVAILITIIFSMCFMCKPISYSFVPIPPGHCGDLQSFELYTAIMSLLCDLWVVILPMPILWRLQMSKSKRLGLVAVFSVGLM